MLLIHTFPLKKQLKIGITFQNYLLTDHESVSHSYHSIITMNNSLNKLSAYDPCPSPITHCFTWFQMYPWGVIVSQCWERGDARS